MASKLTPGRIPPSRGYHHGDLAAALLDAAEHELQENGIEGFSLRLVAKRVGVSHAAPAHHFGDTQGLLTALAARGFQRFSRRQEDFRRKAGASPREQLEASGVGYVIFAIENPALFRLMFNSDRPDFSRAELGQAAGAALDELEQGVKRVRQEAPVACEAAMDVAATWALAHGLADLLIAGRLKSISELPTRARRAAIAGVMSRAMR